MPIKIQTFKENLEALKAGRRWALVPKRIAPKPGEEVEFVDMTDRMARGQVFRVGNAVSDVQGIHQDWAILELYR